MKSFFESLFWQNLIMFPPIDGAAAGIIWIAVAFSGTLALGRAFERERYQDAMRGLLMAPVQRSAIFLGKLLGIILLMAVVEAVVVLFVAFTFQVSLLLYPGHLFLLLVTGTVGFATFLTLALWTFEPVMTE